MQLDLLPPVPLSITPEVGRNEPRVWVRRLVIWKDADTIIRDIELKTGLNIVLSRDPGTGQDGPIGHGAGKTMFCRLLRYCLGEDSIASETQRQRILDKLPNGRVGAEVMLEGTPWVVVRALGHQRQDIVIRNGVLDQVVRDGNAPTGIDVLRDAVDAAVIGDAAQLIPDSIGKDAAWEATLAWMTRDQECRFSHHLDWRDPRTDSHSPVRGRSMEDRLAVVRAMIGALTLDEIVSQKEEDQEDKNEKNFQSELGWLDRQIGKTRSSLTNIFGIAPSSAEGPSLDVIHFRTAASARYAKVLKLPKITSTTDLERARKDRNEAADEVRRFEITLAETLTRIDEKNKVLPMMRAELPEARASLVKGSNPICPICEVPIDRVLAEGCGISLASCDLDSLNAQIVKIREGIESEKREIDVLNSNAPKQRSDIALAQQRLEPLERVVVALERAIIDQSQAIRAAQRLVDEVDRYEASLTEREKIAEQMRSVAARLTKARESLVAHRESAGDAIRRLSEKFAIVLGELVHGDIKGEAKLDGNGLSLKVELSGDLSTAAIDSLKVVAFDLAALMLTIEGKTRLPGLLVHDSPREADLGRSIYDRFFAFAKKIEGFGPSPLFQYIVTTTTEPPKEFQSLPWLRLEVHGTPSEERLLKVDL